MNTELESAFSRASQVAQTEFAMRNAEDVITPAARRVSRHRSAVKMGAGLASLAVVGAIVWGADTIADERGTTVDPAGPTTQVGDGIAVPNNAWSTLDLAVRAKPHQQDKPSTLPSTAGMICHHASPDDDPRIAAKGDDSTVSGRVSLEDCRAAWFEDGPKTTLAYSSVTTGGPDQMFSYRFLIHNDSAQPLAIDADSVFMWIETDPGGTSETVASYQSTLVGGSMWSSRGDVTALLNSGAEPVTIAADGNYSSTITATTGTADGDPLGAILEGSTPYTVTLWARIHEESPSGDATYLVQLGSANDLGAAVSSGCDTVFDDTCSPG